MTHTISEPRSRTYVVTYEWGGTEKQEVYADHALALYRARWLRDYGYLVDSVMIDGRVVR